MFCFLQGFQASETSKRSRFFKRSIGYTLSSPRRSLDPEFEKSSSDREQQSISKLKSSGTQNSFSHAVSQECIISGNGQHWSTSTPVKSSNKNSSLVSITDLSMTLSTSTSNSRQKKFYRHFTQISQDELVINYYNCALDGEILRQGHLYITKNFFAFYSNIFGNITRLLVPITSVQSIKKEKTVKIFPNAVAIVTDNQRYVFCSLLSRDSTFKLMKKVWENVKEIKDEINTPISGEPELLNHPENLGIDDGKISDQKSDELDVDRLEVTAIVYDNCEKLNPVPISTSQDDGINCSKTTGILGVIKKYKLKPTTIITILIALLAVLYISAACMMLRIDKLHTAYINNPLVSSDKLTRDSLLKYLDANLDQIVKVRESLQSLSAKFQTMSQNFDENPTGKTLDSPS